MTDMTIKAIASQLSPEDRKEVFNNANEEVEKFLIELAQMVEDGELSDTAAKKVFKKYQQENTWKIWQELGK